jgi:hypothetical protein
MVLENASYAPTAWQKTSGDGGTGSGSDFVVVDFCSWYFPLSIHMLSCGRLSMILVTYIRMRAVSVMRIIIGHNL